MLHEISKQLKAMLMLLMPKDEDQIYDHVLKEDVLYISEYINKIKRNKNKIK